MKHLGLFEKQESRDVLNYQIRACEKCGLAATRKHALVGEGNITLGFAHICLEMADREKIAIKSEQAGYTITRIQCNDKPDILFIKDKAGNIFELKKGSQ